MSEMWDWFVNLAWYWEVLIIVALIVLIYITKGGVFDALD